MRNDDWADLGSEWRAVDAGTSPDLASRVRNTIRKRRIGLYSELAGTVFALSTIVYTLVRNPSGAGGMLWLAGCAVILVTWQALHLAVRHAHGLFIEPDVGLAGWIEAERRRARYAIVYHWLGLGGGVLVMAWAQQAIGFFDSPVVMKVFAVVAAGFLGWNIVRTWTLRRLLARLAAERAALEG